MLVGAQALFFIIDLVLPLLAGTLIRRSGRATARFMERMTFVGILVIMPILNLLSFWTLSLDPKVLLLPVAGLSMQVVSGGLGYGIARLKYETSRDRGSYFLASMLSNRGIVGALTVFLFYGEGAFAISRLIVVFNDLVLYVVGFPIARRFSTQDEAGGSGKRDGEALGFGTTQLPALGFLLGVLLNLSGLPRPGLLSGAFEYLVHGNAWLVVVPIGYALQLEAIRTYAGDLWELLGIKFIMSPLLAGLVAHALGFGGVRLRVLIILAATPTAISAIFTTRIHRLNDRLALAAFALTTALYPLVVFPLIYLLERLVD
jgi:predicted permease